MVEKESGYNDRARRNYRDDRVRRPDLVEPVKGETRKQREEREKIARVDDIIAMLERSERWYERASQTTFKAMSLGWSGKPMILTITAIDNGEWQLYWLDPAGGGDAVLDTEWLKKSIQPIPA